MTETADITKLYANYVFPVHTYITMIKVELQNRHIKRLTILINNKIEQL